MANLHWRNMVAIMCVTRRRHPSRVYSFKASYFLHNVEVIERPYLYYSCELLPSNISIRVIDSEIDHVALKFGDP
jgi:hypothetical protein